MQWKEVGIVCLIVGILGILCYMGLLKYEGFTVQDQQTYFNNLEAAQPAGKLGTYFNNQTHFYHRQTTPDQTVYVPTTISDGIRDFGDKLNAAFRKPYTTRDRTPDKDYSTYVFKSTVDDLQEKVDFCGTLATVDAWAAAPAVEKGCGWLFIPDEDGGTAIAGQSVSLYGTPEGPHSRVRVNAQDPLRAGRTWYWATEQGVRDAKAAEKEKVCKRIKSCSVLSSNDGCAYDTIKGYGVPLPENLDVAATNIIRTRENCPPQYSFCSDASTVEKRRGCIQTILKYEGYAETGMMYVMGDMCNLILSVVYERARTPTDLQILDAELRGVKQLNNDDWVAFRKKLQYLKNAAVSYDRYLADLAQMLVYGKLMDGRDFDLKNYYTGAAQRAASNADQVAHEQFATNILQTEWRKAGCQPTGSGFPTVGYEGSKSLDMLRNEYKTLHALMLNSESPVLQLEAVRKCLNRDATLNTSIEEGEFCNERGMEYFLYDGPHDSENSILIGHLFSITGFLTDPAKTETAKRMRALFNSASTFPTVSYKMRTMVSTPNEIRMVPHPNWTNRSKYVLEVNKGRVDSTYTVTFPQKRRNIFEMYYKGDRGDAWGSPQYSFVDLNLDMFQLFQSAAKPFVCFTFYESTLLDSNRNVRLDREGELQFVKGDVTKPKNRGIQWNTATPTNSIRINKPIRSSLLQIISQRLWIEGDCVLFSLNQIQGGTPYSEVCRVAGGALIYEITNGFDPLRSVTLATDIPYKTWMNLAIEYEKNPATNTIRIQAHKDESPVGRAGVFTIVMDTFVRPLLVFVMNRDFRGIKAWFNIYDRKLVSDSIEGFQTQGSGAGTGLSILQQEADFNPQEANLTDPIRKTPNIGDFLVNTLKVGDFFGYGSTATASANASTSSADQSGATTVTDTFKCPIPFDPVAVTSSGAISANYKSGAYYKQKFEDKDANPTSTLIGTSYPGQRFESAKECEMKCIGNCQAFTFNSKLKTCKTYNDLGDTLNTLADDDSFSSILKERKNMDYEALKKSTLDAIKKYQEIRDYLKDKDVYKRAIRTRTGFGVFDSVMAPVAAPVAVPIAAPTNAALSTIPTIDDPRSDKEIAKDKFDIENDVYLGQLDCLNGIFQKYRVQ